MAQASGKHDHPEFRPKDEQAGHGGRHGSHQNRSGRGVLGETDPFIPFPADTVGQPLHCRIHDFRRDHQTDRQRKDGRLDARNPQPPCHGRYGQRRHRMNPHGRLAPEGFAEPADRTTKAPTPCLHGPHHEPFQPSRTGNLSAFLPRRLRFCSPMTAPLRIALVAHDHRKEQMTAWAQRHAALLAPHALSATGTTGRRLSEALGRDVHCYLSGPMGGDLQIGAHLAEKQLDALIFFWDPLTAQPHDPDVKALLRVAVLWDVPFACNETSATLLLHALSGLA